MPGNLLKVSVRSTDANGDTIKITRDEAELILQTNTPTVLAIVRRGTIDEVGKVAIRFPDDSFIRELDCFLQSNAKSHQLRFSDAVTEIGKIHYNADRLFREAYADQLVRLRAKGRLENILPDANIEIVHTEQGTFPYVRSKEFDAPIHIAQRPDVMEALSDIGMPFKALLPLNGFALEYGDLFQTHTDSIGAGLESSGFPETSMTSVELPGKQVKKPSDSSLRDRDQVEILTKRICDELSLMNLNIAADLANQIHQSLDSGGSDGYRAETDILVLLARVDIKCVETKPHVVGNHIARAKALLEQAEQMIKVSDSNILAEIFALKAAITNLNMGPDVALAMLEGRTDPYAIRTRVALLVSQQKTAEALSIIEGVDPHERWCDVAVTAYALNDELEKAQDMVRWAAGLADRSCYLRCIVRLADAMMERALVAHVKSTNILPGQLTSAECDKMAKVIETIEPVLQPIRAAGKPNSGLDSAALQIAWRASYLLKRRETAAELLRLMLNWSPVSLDAARGVIAGYVQSPPDLPDRIREDHPGELQANILAAVIESSVLGLYEKAFAEAKELLPQAESKENKEELFRLLQQIWQGLKEPESTECEEITRGLVRHNPRMLAMFEASVALRNGDVERAESVLNAHKSEDDPFLLQLRANILLCRKRFAEALDFLMAAIDKNPIPSLLQRAGDVAFEAKKFDVAAQCYERLLDVQPENLSARGNLAHIYTFRLFDMEKAAGHFKALRMAEPTNTAHTFNLAVCLAQLFRPEESLAFYDELCSLKEPILKAVVARAQLHHSLGNPQEALSSLEEFRDRFWNDPEFVMAYMTVAHAAGNDAAGDEALIAMSRLREQGAIPPETFRAVKQDEALEMFKESFAEAQKRDQKFHIEMVKGRMPWVWAEQMANNAIYWGWRIRTASMDWIGDEPTNRARYSMYSTNGFHPRDSEPGKKELLPLECPPPGTKVVADISALITLHRLELLDAAAGYFGEILVPAGYLPMVLEDSRKMVLHQRSRRQSAELIDKLINAGRITALEDGSEAASKLPIVDEHIESDEHCYRLVDLIEPVYAAGRISEADFARISGACGKSSGADETHSALAQFQALMVDLSTLEVVAHFGLLESLAGFYGIHITDKAKRETRQQLEAIAYQEETREWHMDLWKRLRNDARFKFVPHIIPEQIKEKAKDLKDYLPFLSAFVALEKKVPLLADDRISQGFALNLSNGISQAAFGSDVLVLALMSAGKLNAQKATAAIKQLMDWRYRFIVPPPELLKTLADKFKETPPGESLRDVAEYIQNCMRDPGLFYGHEKTEAGESMAMRLYLTWVSFVAQFLVLVWADDTFTLESATRLTEWSLRELLPSLPRTLDARAATKMAAMTQRTFLSHALLKMALNPGGPRMADCMKAMKDSMRLSNEEYHKIVSSVLEDVARLRAGSEEERADVTRMLKRIRNYALLHFNMIEPRTQAVLKNLNILDEEGVVIGADVDPQALRNPGHPRRAKFPPGPMFGYVTEDHPPTKKASEISVFLYSELPEIRRAALEELENIVKQGILGLTPNSRKILEKSRGGLLSDDPHEWRGVAIALNDAFSDDALLAVSGVRQALESDPVIQDSLNIYARRVFHPPVSSLDSISLDVKNPKNDHSRLAEIVESVVEEASSIADVCGRYFNKLGFLPLAARFSMAEVISRRLKNHPEEDIWSEVWRWADGAHGPIPQYHACSVFVLRPELMPEGKSPELWRRIMDVVREPDKADESKSIDREPWRLRRDLARHFVYHLEANLPDNDGGNIACFAWWFAGQVAELFPDKPESAQFYRKNWVESAENVSTHIWLTASSHIGRSYLRYITMTTSSPWATALMALMGSKLDLLAPWDQPPETQAAFHKALVSSLVGALPVARESPEEPTYAQECAMIETTLKWSAHTTEEDRTGLEQIVAMTEKLGSVEGLCAALRKLAESSLIDQIAVALALKAKAYTDPKVADGVWELLSDAEWRQQVLGSVDEHVLGLLVEAFCILLADQQEKWRFHLPQYLAELCEKTENDERRQELFIYTLHASLASYTVSAVRRLLRGSQKGKFAALANEYRVRIENMWSEYPPWVQARMRGLLASLRAG